MATGNDPMTTFDKLRSGASRRGLVFVLAALALVLIGSYFAIVRDTGDLAFERARTSGLEVVPRELSAADAPVELAAPQLAAGFEGTVRDEVMSGVRLSGHGKLTGVVLVRETGLGLAGARVELLPLPPIGAGFIGRMLRLARLGDGFTRRARPVAVTDTNTLGQFEFEGVREGRYYVDIASDYHLLEAAQRVSVLASGAGGPAEVWVRGGGRVLGQVVDLEGRGVASATVLLTSGPNLFLESAREGSLRLVETRSDTDGHFGFGGVAAGEGYDLTAIAPRIAISHLSGVVVTRGEDTRVVLRARAGGTVVGRVFSARVDEEGDERGRVPLAGAHVGAIPRGLRDMRFLEEVLTQTHCETDEDGAYRMRHVPPGDVDIVVYAPDHILGGGALVVVREGELSSAAPIIMETGDKLEGRVVDTAGEPIAGVHVTWTTFDTKIMRRRGMDLTLAPFLTQAVEGFAFPYTDEDGRFAAGPFPGEAPHRLRFYKEGFREHVQQCTLDEQPLTVILQRGGSIEGVVMDFDEAVPVTSFAIQTIDRIETTEDAPGRFNPFSGGQVFEDEGGRFKLDAMRTGEVEFIVTAPGYSPESVEGITVVEGETKRGVIISMRQGGSLRGVVQDQEGAPIAGASVMAFDSSVERGREFGRPRDPSKLPTRIPRFSQGLPPALLGYAAGLGLLADDAVRTKQDGTFELTSIAPGSISVVAFHPDFAAGHSPEFELEVGESVDDVLVELTSGAGVYGTVKDRRGRPVVGSMVVAMSPARFAGKRARSAGGGLYQAQTDLEGAYEIEHMVGGSFFIVSMRGDEALNPLSFFSTLDFDLMTVPADKRVRFDIIDESLGGTRVFGRVLEAGAPVARGNINAICWEGENVLGVDWKLARIDSQGGYEFEGLAPGEYQFQLEGLAQRVKLTVEIPDQSEYHLDLELPHGVVEGRVVDDTTGEPVARATVYLRPTDEVEADSMIASLIRKSGQLHIDSTDAEGVFSFGSLGEGEYELHVNPRGAKGSQPLASSEPERFFLALNEVRSGVEVRLRSAAQLTGTVRDESGAPIEGARVTCMRSDEADVKPERTRSEAGGSFRITGLSVGEHSVFVSAPGYADSRSDGVQVVVGEGAPLDVRLERGVSVTLVLTDPSGAFVSGASARLVRTDAPSAEAIEPNRAMRALLSGKATTDASGELELGRYSAGTYELSVWRGLSRKKQPGVQLERDDDSMRLRVTLD